MGCGVCKSEDEHAKPHRNTEANKHAQDDSVHFIFHITGYSKFQHISDYQAERLVENLRKDSYLQHSVDDDYITIGSLHTVASNSEYATQQLLRIREQNEEIKGRIEAAHVHSVYLHFGVFSERPYFGLASTAYNEANYPWPDAGGWQPRRIAIVRQNGDVRHRLHSKLPVDALQNELSYDKYNVEVSDDAGRFVENWLYYWSLHLCSARDDESALFVHVPSYDSIGEEVQLQFAKDLVLAIADRI